MWSVYDTKLKGSIADLIPYLFTSMWSHCIVCQPPSTIMNCLNTNMVNDSEWKLKLSLTIINHHDLCERKHDSRW